MLRFLFVLAAVQMSVSYTIGQAFPQDCRERYRKGLEVNPKSSLVHFRIAECFFNMGRPCQALRAAGLW